MIKYIPHCRGKSAIKLVGFSSENLWKFIRFGSSGVSFSSIKSIIVVKIILLFWSSLRLSLNLDCNHCRQNSVVVLTLTIYYKVLFNTNSEGLKKVGLCPKQRIIIKSLCYRGLSEGWDKILGLYSSVREKGKEIIDQVHLTFSTYTYSIPF